MFFPWRPSSRRRNDLSTRLGLFTVLGLVLFLAACGGGSPSTGTTGGSSCPSARTLNGAGSTFDYPLFSKMFSEYPNVKCGAQVNYQSVGSGAGINNLLQQVVDFGATDMSH
jgi:phosphate transport system substrate-binding protein